jgi:hypothetical protein
MSVLYANNINTNGIMMSSTSPVRYSGRWSLNNATSIPTGTATSIASSASNWTIMPGFLNNNAAALLNANGGITFPTKGTFHIASTIIPTSVSSLTDYEAYFQITFKAGGTSDRLGWVKYPYAGSNTATISLTDIVDVSAGDILYIFLYQASSATFTLQTNSTPGTGLAGQQSTASTQLSCRLLYQLN